MPGSNLRPTALLLLLLVTTGARGRPEPLITDGPKAWALATTAILTFRNGDRIDMLAPGPRTEASITEARGILRDWWNVDGKASLQGALDFCRHGGHRADFQRQGGSLAGMSDARFRAFLSAQRSHPERAQSLKRIRDHYRKYGDRSLVAWDYARYIMLCRWGYMVGFLSEREAWDRIMPAALTIQRAFHSWHELGEDYLAGRVFWSREQTEQTGRAYAETERWLENAPQSPWRRLVWGLPLGYDAARDRPNP
jgi:uncharacterized protein DUF1266